VCIVFAAAGSGCGSGRHTPTTTIPFVNDFTGAYSQVAQNVQNGLLLAADDINAQGGVLGHSLSFDTRDSRGFNDVAANLARDFVKSGQSVIIAPVSSSGTLNMLQVTGPAHVVLMAPASVSTDLTNYNQSLADRKDSSAGYFFRTIATQSGLVTALAKHASTAGLLKVAVISSFANNTAALYFQTVFQDLVKVRGGQVVYLTSYPSPLGEDFPIKDTLRRAFSFSPDAILLASTEPDGTAFLRAWVQLGASLAWNGAWLVLDSMMFPSVALNVGKTFVTGIIGATPARPDTSSWTYFQQHYKAAFGEPAAQASPEGYDCVFLLALAMEQAGSTDSEAVRQALPLVANPPGEQVFAGDWATARALVQQGTDVDYVGAAGPQDFNALGDVQAPVQLWTFDSDGNIQQLEQVDVSAP